MKKVLQLKKTDSSYQINSDETMLISIPFNGMKIKGTDLYDFIYKDAKNHEECLVTAEWVSGISPTKEDRVFKNQLDSLLNTINTTISGTASFEKNE
jgi:hypothetical protein